MDQVEYPALHIQVPEQDSTGLIRQPLCPKEMEAIQKPTVGNHGPFPGTNALNGMREYLSGGHGTIGRIDGPNPNARRRRLIGAPQEATGSPCVDGHELLGELSRYITPAFDLKVIFLALIPLRRTENGEVERVEAKAFITANSVRDIGVDLGVWELKDGTIGTLLPHDLSRRVHAG